MTVAEYAPKQEPEIHAALWTGEASCLDGMPDVDELSHNSRINKGNGDLTLWRGSQDQEVVRVNKDYIVRGITGFFWVMEKEEFEANYQLVATKVEE